MSAELKDLEEWVKQNIPEKKWKDSGDTILAALVWAACVYEAEGYEDYTTKDFAELLQCGIPAFSIEDLAEWVEGFREVDDPDTIPRSCQDYLKTFWEEQ